MLKDQIKINKIILKQRQKMEKSKSTDKLELLLNAIKNVPEETINRVKKVQLTWIVLDNVLLPQVKIEF